MGGFELVFLGKYDSFFQMDQESFLFKKAAVILWPYSMPKVEELCYLCSENTEGLLEAFGCMVLDSQSLRG